jgi:hypothetical protein
VPFSRRITTGALGAVLVACLAACGDQPTANRDFHAVATHSSFLAFGPEPYALHPAPVSHQVLSGYLVGAGGKPIAGSLFYEDCITVVPYPHEQAGPTFCTATVMTGTNTYVARGSGHAATGGVPGLYYGMLGSLGPGPVIGPGSAVMWLLPDGSGTTPVQMKISFRLWGSEPVFLP